MTPDEAFTVKKLIASACLRYGYRAQRPGESDEQYRMAAHAEVRKFDFALSFEIKLGRVQAEWTAAEVEAFRVFASSGSGPRRRLDPFKTYECVETEGFDLTVDALHQQAEINLAAFRLHQVQQPGRSLPVVLDALLADGRMLTFLPDSEDRLSLLLAIAETHTLWGFVLTYDAWGHRLDNVGTPHATAHREEVFMCRIKTRDYDHLWREFYTRDASGAGVFQPREDSDLLGAQRLEIHSDPYADVFAIPTQTRRPQ
jgi:hypothetical protein